MKKTLLPFLIGVLVILTSIYWFLNADTQKSVVDNIHFIAIFILALFGFIIGYTRLKSRKRGEPVDDEMTRSQVQRSAAISYFISLYLWVFIIFIKDRIHLDTEEWLGTGILGMGTIFMICLLFFRIKGSRND